MMKKSRKSGESTTDSSEKEDGGRPFDSYNPSAMALLMQDNGAMASQTPFLPNQNQLPLPPQNHSPSNAASFQQFSKYQRMVMADDPKYTRMTIGDDAKYPRMVTEDDAKYPRMVTGDGFKYPRMAIGGELKYHRGNAGEDPSFVGSEDILSNISFESMQQAGTIADYLATSSSSDTFQTSAAIFCGGQMDGSRNASLRPNMRGVASPGAGMRLPHMIQDLNMYPFDFTSETRQRVRQELQHQQQTMQPDNLYAKRQVAETSTSRLSAVHPVPFCSRQQVMPKIKSERDSTPEMDTPSTTTPTSAIGNSEASASSPTDVGPSFSSSPTSSREDTPVSGVTSTNESALASGTKTGKFTSVQEKDEAYWEKRRKNNESAKRSREARRNKEAQINCQVLLLEQEHLALSTELEMVIRDCQMMEKEVRRRQMKAERERQVSLYDYPPQTSTHPGPPPPPPPNAGTVHL